MIKSFARQQILARHLNKVLAALAFSVALSTGCTTKNYVRTQTAPLIQKTNELDDQAAANNRNIQDVNARAQSGISQAQSAANAADQKATAAGQSATTAQQSAQEAVNRADSLASVVANLDSYTKQGEVEVNFKFDKAELTREGKSRLDEFAGLLGSTKGYLLEVTGGTDSVGGSDYNYQLSQRRAEAVVQYLATKYNVAPHRFYLIGIGKDQEVASNKTAAGRAKNRRVQVQLLSNRTGSAPVAPATSGS